MTTMPTPTQPSPSQNPASSRLKRFMRAILFLGAATGANEVITNETGCNPSNIVQAPVAWVDGEFQDHVYGDVRDDKELLTAILRELKDEKVSGLNKDRFDKLDMELREYWIACFMENANKFKFEGTSAYDSQTVRDSLVKEYGTLKKTTLTRDLTDEKTPVIDLILKHIHKAAVSHAIANFSTEIASQQIGETSPKQGLSEFLGIPRTVNTASPTTQPTSIGTSTQMEGLLAGRLKRERAASKEPENTNSGRTT